MRARFSGHGAAALVAALAWGAAGCGGWDTTDDWDGGAARAVARHVDATIPDGRMVVLGEIGGYDGEPLPWGVRQSLTTAGFEIGDSASLRDPAVFMLVFDASAHDGDAWDIRTRLLHRDEAPVQGTWRVLCQADQCTVEGPPGAPAPAPEPEPELYPEPPADTSAFTAPPPGSGPPPDSLT